MEGKVIPIGSRAVTLYYIALGTVIALLAVIIIGILISIARLPPCTAVTQNICGVNDWSIAGLAATILGVGATVLAFLGAFAVAAWWKDLNKLVDERVDKQVTVRMEQLKQAQVKELKEYLLEVSTNQKNMIAHATTQQDQEIETLKAKINTLLDVAMRPDLQDIDAYVQSHWVGGVSEMAQQMARLLVLRYIKIIQAFQQNAHKQRLFSDHAIITPVECFEAASLWVERVKEHDQRVNLPHQPIQNQSLHGLASILDHDVNVYRSFIDDWQARNPETLKRAEQQND